jgi:hypothetical protein
MNSPLDQLLLDHGFPANPDGGPRLEGYMTPGQKKQFCDCLKTYPRLERIAEIGLNAGHSAENFLESCPNLKQFVSFDLCFHDYTLYCIDYLQNQYKEKFHFVKGDSRKTVKEYAKQHPEKTFDLIYIDGNHVHECCTADLINCQSIAHPGTFVWIDDYQYLSVFLAVHEQAHAGLIEIVGIHETKDLEGSHRCWVEAKYLFPKS